MVFSSPVFLFLFLPLVLTLYFVTPRQMRNLMLVLTSLLFYAWGEPSFVGIMLVSIGANYVFGLLLGRIPGGWTRRVVVAVAIAANLGLLAAFKYLGFLAANVNQVLEMLGHSPVVVMPPALPLGISFFTFHALSYVIDVYRGTVAPQTSPLLMALYIAFFPQLIAGPIVRYHEIAAQLVHRVVTRQGFATGARRFVIGLGKKVLIANAVAGPADTIFALAPGQLTTALSWLGIACYTLQIYFDFSGYSDMAIGLARMFGFTFPENFAHPYAARSVTEFWRRWHMSLSRWFRDYLYVPLGGNRRGRLRTYTNLVTVFFLCGLWHGAEWTFVAWGLYHGAFLVMERGPLGRWVDALSTPLRHGYLVLVVMIGWVFFRATTFTSALEYLSAMMGRSPAVGSTIDALLWLEPWQVLAFGAGVVGSLPWAPRGRELRERIMHPLARGTLACAETAALAVVLFASALMLAAGTYNPFIYFRF